MNVEGWYSPPSNPNNEAFQYFVYAAAVTEIQQDVLTGQTQVLSAEIVYDCGKLYHLILLLLFISQYDDIAGQSLNPAIDIGQIVGGYNMGIGYFLTEHVYYDVDGIL